MQFVPMRKITIVKFVKCTVIGLCTKTISWFFFSKSFCCILQKTSFFFKVSILVIEFCSHNHNEQFVTISIHIAYKVWTIYILLKCPVYALRSINKTYFQVYHKDKRSRKLHLPSLEFWMRLFSFSIHCLFVWYVFWQPEKYRT